MNEDEIEISDFIKATRKRAKHSHDGELRVRVLGLCKLSEQLLEQKVLLKRVLDLQQKYFRDLTDVPGIEIDPAVLRLLRGE